MQSPLSTPFRHASFSRRRFLWQSALGAAFLTAPGAFAQELTGKSPARTASVEEGPFYPPKLPLDTDNDLLIVNDSITPAVGEIAHVSGRLLDAKGEPVRNATIEIWSVDGHGNYLADKSVQAKYDAHFQGFGRFLTGSTGEYYFRTLKPVNYPGRQAPHIHYKIKRKGQNDWTTQLFVKGFPTNIKDGIFRRLDETARETVTMDFVPLKDSRIGEVAARFDIVVGVTAQA
jgi:protocatechuate 3,4-dioxygenase beta subunit